jgi:hypothetical protein
VTTLDESKVRYFALSNDYANSVNAHHCPGRCRETPRQARHVNELTSLFISSFFIVYHVHLQIRRLRAKPTFVCLHMENWNSISAKKRKIMLSNSDREPDRVSFLFNITHILTVKIAVCNWTKQAGVFDISRRYVLNQFNPFIVYRTEVLLWFKFLWKWHNMWSPNFIKQYYTRTMKMA